MICDAKPCPLCGSGRDRLECVAVIFEREKRERLKNATASNVELTARARYNRPRARSNCALEIEAALVAEVVAAIASLPPMSDEPDDIPF